jgi:hypothetical protein
MPLSTSSSDPGQLDGDSYERPLPALSAGVASGVALLLFVLALAAWELYWRDFGVIPGYRNSDARWTEQRRRIDHGEGNRTVIVGSSRLLFDVQLPVWERLAGERPIQLALEGSSPVAFLEDLADDPDFSGRLLVGVTPGLFFSGFAARIDALKHYRKETPAQRSGHLLSTWLLEPWLAYYDEDFALITVLERQPWPTRPGVPVREAVRKIMVTAADRNTRMWDKVENDPDYQAMAQRIWAQNFRPLPPEAIEKAMKTRDEQIDKAVAAVGKLRARGVEVVFVRAPSGDQLLDFERANLPRESTWDVLIAKAGVPGIHFEDYPELQGYHLPEWSHLSASEADRFTAALYPIAERAFASQAEGG